MKVKKWSFRSRKAIIPEILLSAGYSPLLAAILFSRGIDSPEKAKGFLSCSISSLADPLLMADMIPAVERITIAIARGEKIAVFGDYDVDGITSSCMVTHYLRKKGVDCVLYIPDRISEGYGVNKPAIDRLKAEGVSLILTVDCGVSTVEEARYASSLGMDMVITDHHECREELPDAVAVVDPKRKDCDYPQRDLAGVGVAFKLLCALDGSAERILNEYADLVAVGTVADVMPIIGENRFIVKTGLDKLAKAPCEGLRALLEQTNTYAKPISTTTIGYTLAPRINASGRLGDTGTATGLLLSETSSEAEKLALELCDLNRTRQTLEAQIWEEASEMLGPGQRTAPVVLAHDGWHQGVIGIVASKITEKYNVPSVMICLDGEKGKGSCRSFGDFNLFEALSACSEFLEGFGGHALAAGLTIKEENIEAFRQAMADFYLTHPPLEGNHLDIDFIVSSPSMLTVSSVEDLDRLEPCGTGNPKPLLAIENAKITDLKVIGGGKHLKLKLSKFGKTYDAVYFSVSLSDLGIGTGDFIDVVFTPQINEYNHQRNVQFLVSDLKKHDFSAAEKILRGDFSDVSSAPDRTAFASVWRGVQESGKRLLGKLGPVSETMGCGLDDSEKFTCLKVLEELGLLSVCYDGKALDIEIRSNEKVDLSSSAILKEIQNAQ